MKSPSLSSLLYLSTLLCPSIYLSFYFAHVSSVYISLTVCLLSLLSLNLFPSVFAPLSTWLLSLLFLSHNLHRRTKLYLRFSLYRTLLPHLFLTSCSIFAPLSLSWLLSLSQYHLLISFLSLFFSIAAPFSVFALSSIFVPLRLLSSLYNLSPSFYIQLLSLGFSRLTHSNFLYLSSSFYRPLNSLLSLTSAIFAPLSILAPLFIFAPLFLSVSRLSLSSLLSHYLPLFSLLSLSSLLS